MTVELSVCQSVSQSLPVSAAPRCNALSQPNQQANRQSGLCVGTVGQPARWEGEGSAPYGKYRNALCLAR